MPRMTILNIRDFKEFESAPEFDYDDRNKFFAINNQLKKILSDIKTPQNKIYLMLMLGYFKCTNKFYTKDFSEKDIRFLCKKLSVDFIEPPKYYDQMIAHYKKVILNYFRHKPYGKEAENILRTDIGVMVRAQIRPKLMFIRCTELLRQHKFEIPSHHIISKFIIREMNLHKKELTESVCRQMTKEIANAIDYLVDNSNEDDSDHYPLTLLKKFHQSTKPMKIKANIADLISLKVIYDKIYPIYSSLNLNSEGLRFYASYVLKSRVSQIKKKKDQDKYLHLITFIAHQYFTLQDTLVKILSQAVKKSTNGASRKHKDKCYENRKDNFGKIKELASYSNKSLSKLQAIKQIVESTKQTDTAKLKQIKSAIYSGKESVQKLIELAPDSSTIKEDGSYYDMLEKQSIKLQHRVSDIIQHLDFCKITSCPALLAAINYYRDKEASVDKKAPIDFLSVAEQGMLYDEQGKFRVSLYKILLFKQISEAIRSGQLNLKHSYQNKPLSDYMISNQMWEANRGEYIKNAGLEKFADCDAILNGLDKAMDDQYHATNKRINDDSNNLISFNKSGEFVLKTPKVDKEAFIPLSEYFPTNQYIPLLEVLNTVNKEAHFIDEFEPWQQKYQRQKKPTASILAGVVGLGCSIGEHKIVKISRAISESELSNTVNWYFDADNINNANNKIMQLAIKSGIPDLYLAPGQLNHTSSDGYKKNVVSECLDADYSFKYHGQAKGVSVYGFIDSRHLLFSSTVISSSEREAAYVIDGLMRNDVVKSDIHSTDTHGYSELIFGTTHLMDVSFAPRIKNLKKQQIYSFKKKSCYENLGYKILPKKYINKEIIVKQWDDILRFMATIKLKETTASQLFKRLNSYSRQHNLYRALKEFGKIIKSIFILKYINDVELRQAIEKQLNKVESSNKFARAISFGNNQEFKQDTKEEQVIAEGCSRIIKNSIICWNYLYLRKQIANENNMHKRQELLDAIKNGSVVTWQHINLHGEYDFSEDKLYDSIGLSLTEEVLAA